MDKQEIRQHTLKAMRSIDNSERQAWQQNLYDQLSDYLDRHHSQRVGFYYGFEPELETQTMIEQLEQEGYEVYLPKIQADHGMEFHRFLGADQMENVWRSLMEPPADSPQITGDQLDLLIMPGVAFQANGVRIGFGGGYYDRYLERYPDLKTLSLIFPVQLYDESLWEQAEHDLPVDLLMVAETE